MNEFVSNWYKRGEEILENRERLIPELEQLRRVASSYYDAFPKDALTGRVPIDVVVANDLSFSVNYGETKYTFAISGETSEIIVSPKLNRQTARPFGLDRIVSVTGNMSHTELVVKVLDDGTRPDTFQDVLDELTEKLLPPR